MELSRHLRDIFTKTPSTMSDIKRTLRIQMIQNISDMSNRYNQEEIGNKVYVDLDSNGNIVGLDVSVLIGLKFNCCVGKRVKLKDMTIEYWANMSVPN